MKPFAERPYAMNQSQTKRLARRPQSVNRTVWLLLLSALLLLAAASWLSCSSSGSSSQPCTMNVTSPNGGESWLRGELHTITWSATHSGGSVRIELHRDGAYYATIAQSTDDDGAFEYRFESADPSSHYRIRVCSTSDGGCCDDSDEDFTITASCDLTITNPTSGSSWIPGEEWNISWSPSGGVGTVKLELYQGAASICTIDAAAPNTGSYLWNVDDCGGGVSSDYKIKITDNSVANCYDYSDNFSIGQACTFTITNPRSTSTWTNGESRTISWIPTGGGRTVRLELFEGSLYLCPIIGSTADDGSYTWTVSDCARGFSTEYRVKITDTGDATCFDYSDYFTIGAQCGFNLTNPHAASTWMNGEDRSILWDATGGSGSVRLELFQGTTLLCTIAASAPNSGSYQFSSDYRLKITDTADAACYSYSDYFTIGEVCGFIVTNPHDGSTWMNNEERSILWDPSGGSGTVKIELYLGATPLCTIISSTANDGSHLWLVNDCGGGFSSEYRVKITDTADTTCTVFSEPFTIGAACGFVITNPYSSSVWANGEERTILWEPSGGSGTVQIDLFKGATLLCTISASTANDGAYEWIADDCGGGFSSEYRVKITDTADANCYEYSDLFTIGAACTFEITNPHVGSSWSNGEGRSILWDATGGSGTVRIELYHGAVALCTINTSTANDGSYQWIVNDCGGGVSSEYRVKITDTDDANCYSYSDYFTIGEACGFTITNPYSASIWRNGESRTVLWEASGGSGSVKIDLYEAATFLCNIDPSTPNDGSYSWSVDDCGNGYSAEYRVKITDVADSTCYAYSDLFTIGEACGITITNPYSASIWSVGENRTIMWSPTGGSGTVKIELYHTATYLCDIIASTANDGFYQWSVSDCGVGTSSEFEVKITDSVDTSCYEYSDNFTINAP